MSMSPLKGIRLNYGLPVTMAALSILLFSGALLAHSWRAPETEAERQNPIPLNEDSSGRGRRIFMQKCTFCHGNGAEGLSSESTGLQKDTPNLMQRLKNHSEGDFHWKIKTGKDQMPSFRTGLSDCDIWDVVNLIKSIDRL
jgi:mono/diheme cytochrome c family protein